MLQLFNFSAAVRIHTLY